MWGSGSIQAVHGAHRGILIAEFGAMVLRVPKFFLISAIFLSFLLASEGSAKPPRVAVKVLSNPSDQGAYEHSAYEHYEIQADGGWKIVAVEGNYVDGRRPLVQPSGQRLPSDVTDKLNALLDPLSAWSLEDSNDEWVFHRGGSAQKPFSVSANSVRLGVQVELNKNFEVEFVSVSLFQMDGSASRSSVLAARGEKGLEWKMQESAASIQRRANHEIRPDLVSPLQRALEKVATDPDGIENAADDIRSHFGALGTLNHVMGLDAEEKPSDDKIVEWAQKTVRSAQRVKENRVLIADSSGVKKAKIEFRADEPHLTVDGISRALIPSKLLGHYRSLLGPQGPKEITWEDSANGLSVGPLQHFLVDLRGQAPAPFWVVGGPSGPILLAPSEISLEYSRERKNHGFDQPLPTAIQCEDLYNQLQKKTD